MIAHTETAWMRSSAVARRLGLATDTLKKWRSQEKGPKGWKRVSPTVVMYPVAEVLQFEKTWHEAHQLNESNPHSNRGIQLAH
jgi:transposase-like protein